MKKLKQEEFIEKAIKVHGDKYDYSKVKYVNTKEKVCIICPMHGEFLQSPDKHLLGQGCPKCNNHQLSNEEKKEIVSKLHDNKYDYSKSNFHNVKSKTTVICRIHGEFLIDYDHHKNHLRGCPKCKCNTLHNIFKKDTEEFINSSKIIHENKYDYSKTYYINNSTKVCIICKEHGEFWQRPDKHLLGQGCPKCNYSHLENEIRNLLLRKNELFEEQKRFDWLGKQSLDFYLPQYNVAIECQGGQHFYPVQYFGGTEVFEKNIKLDMLKKEICAKHNIKILYFSNLGINYPYQVFENGEELIKYVKKS